MNWSIINAIPISKRRLRCSQTSDFSKKSDVLQQDVLRPSEQFRRLFISYTKAINWFGGVDGFVEAHQPEVVEQLIRHLIDDEV